MFEGEFLPLSMENKRKKKIVAFITAQKTTQSESKVWKRQPRI